MLNFILVVLIISITICLIVHFMNSKSNVKNVNSNVNSNVKNLQNVNKVYIGRNESKGPYEICGSSCESI